MDNAQILSPKVSFDEAIKFLGMSGMDKAMAIQSLLRISEHDGIPLFFDELLTCVQTSIKYGDQYDNEGEFIETLLIDPKDEREFWGRYTLDSFQLYISPENEYELIVHQVIHDGIKYYISQPDGTISEGVPVGYEKFYFDREQLISYKTEYLAHFSNSQKVKDNSSKRIPKMERRITAFKYWLVGNGGKSIHNPEDLQSCYENLGKPTRNQVWKGLKKMDNELFSHNKTDFMKAAAKVISFKLGTGKDRNP